MIDDATRGTSCSQLYAELKDQKLLNCYVSVQGLMISQVGVASFLIPDKFGVMTQILFVFSYQRG